MTDSIGPAPTSPAGPYLLAALLCDRILVEKDGSKSLIRQIDKLTQTAMGTDPPEEMEPFTHTVSMYVCLRRGDQGGKHQLGVTIVGPSGSRTTILATPIDFEGVPGSGIDLTAELPVRIEKPGAYWFEVALNASIITRVPLRVNYERVVRPAAAPEAPER